MNRDDFFTLIHKGLRRELFALTTTAASMDWTDPAALAAFDATWQDLHHLLDIHARHEDEFFFPLIRAAAPDLLAAVDADHDVQEQALDKVAAVIAHAVAAPSPEQGLRVHRELSAFVAGYLLHLLDEETRVMPAIWEHCSDEELARTRGAFLAAMAPSDAELSRRVMLPAISPQEKAAVLAAIAASG